MRPSIPPISSSAPPARGEAMEGPRKGPDRDGDADDAKAARTPAPAPTGQGTKVDVFA